MWCFSSVSTSPRTMATAIGSGGSSTFTTWNLRVSAASFSKYFLYSAHVVAAMVRSSPRASAGFSRFAASPCPAEPPAPISWCASSMNMMMGFGDAFTSSITPRSRFSNSPFTPAPACSSPRSSVRSVTPCSAGGTSPEASRTAKPSTTAVLPTPASPVRMGLFCRRRVRISTIWRISLSRPRIGSIFPARACAVRSVVNWSSAAVPRGTDGVPSPADCVSPVALACASAASALLAVTVAKSRFSRSGLTRSNCPDASRARRASVSSASRAQSRWPERMRGAPCSSDASSQACLLSSTMSGANDGARELPVFSFSSARFRSVTKRP